MPAYGTEALFPEPAAPAQVWLFSQREPYQDPAEPRIGTRVKAVADVDFIFYGYSDVKDLDATLYRERVDPYYIESDAAYLDVYRILPHLDLRIGRQIVSWGSADKFNPTNNLNTLDFSDPLAVRQGAGQPDDPPRLEPDRAISSSPRCGCPSSGPRACRAPRRSR